MLKQGNYFKGHNELNTGGGESRVAENNTRQNVTQGGMSHKAECNTRMGFMKFGGGGAGGRGPSGTREAQ